jgi:hypothetical protein
MRAEAGKIRAFSRSARPADRAFRHAHRRAGPATRRNARDLEYSRVSTRAQAQHRGLGGVSEDCARNSALAHRLITAPGSHAQGVKMGWGNFFAKLEQVLARE